MKAAVYEAPFKVEVRDTESPAPGPGEVLVRVAACGICGTDQHIFRGEFFPSYPLIGGHEFAGEIAAVGDGVETVREGERVAVDPSVFCGQCFYCQRGQGNHCLRWNAIGVTRNGGFAEYAAVPAANVYPIGDLPYEQAAFIEPISCVVYGLKRLAIPTGANALIYGAGPMGLLMLQLVRHGGASDIAVVDLKPEKLGLAHTLGANHALAADIADEALRELSPLGFDVVVDCTGVPKVIEHMLGFARHEAKVLFFGVAPPDEPVAVSPYDVYAKDLEIYGSFALRFTFHQAIALLRSGAVDVQPLISHRLPIEQFAAALDLAGSGEALKVQIQQGS